MRLLLDTHIVVWSLFETGRLPRRALAYLQDPSTEPVVSVVAIWEISIKHAKHAGRNMPPTGSEALGLLRTGGVELLPVMPDHAAAIDLLPPIHRDPFDRMLIAQALTEPLRLLTADATLARYSDTVILV